MKAVSFAEKERSYEKRFMLAGGMCVDLLDDCAGSGRRALGPCVLAVIVPRRSSE